MNISTDKAVDILIEITPHVAEIISDKEMKTLIEKFQKTKSNSVELITSLIPILLKKHRKAIYVIIASVNEITVEDVAKQSIFVTAKQIREIAEDEDLMSFFTSSKNQAQTEDTEQKTQE